MHFFFKCKKQEDQGERFASATLQKYHREKGEGGGGRERASEVVQLKIHSVQDKKGPEDPKQF